MRLQRRRALSMFKNVLMGGAATSGMDKSRRLPQS